jgi:hypothetical protein
VAREFAAQFKLSLPILVDTLDDRMEKAFAGWPDRIYIIGGDGKIAYKGRPGPRGFIVAEAIPVMDRLLGLTPSPEVEIPPMMRERLATLLERMGADDKQKAAIFRAAGQRMTAFRDLEVARALLFEAARPGGPPEDAAKAAENYEAARKRLLETLEKADRELDAAVNYSKDPGLRARLTVFGLLGFAPELPLVRMMGGGAGSPPRP